jgi:hypothetical protein
MRWNKSAKIGLVMLISLGAFGVVYSLCDRWGCIALKTADVNEIYRVSRSGTLVEIVP